MCYVFYTHIDIYCYSTIDLTYILFHQIYIYIKHDTCFVNLVDSFIPAIMLKTLRFKSLVLFGTHTILDKALRLLELPIHRSYLTANGYL